MLFLFLLTEVVSVQIIIQALILIHYYLIVISTNPLIR